MTDWTSPLPGSKDQQTAHISTIDSEQEKLARDVMQYGAITVGRDQSVYEAIGILVDKGLSGLPVVDHGRLVGIISEKDVLRLLYEEEYLQGSVSDYMTEEVVSYHIEDRLSKIAECFLTHGFRRVAILHEDQLAGVITRADIIKHEKERLYPGQEQASSVTSHTEPIARNVMKCGLLTVKTDTSLHEAASLLSSHHITGLPVVDDYMQLVGIISEKDILRALYDADVHANIVADLMTEKVVSFSPKDSLFNIVDCLIHNEFRRVTILDEGRLVGIISRADLLLYIMKNKSTVFQRNRIEVSV